MQIVSESFCGGCYVSERVKIGSTHAKDFVILHRFKVKASMIVCDNNESINTIETIAIFCYHCLLEHHRHMELIRQTK